MITARRSLACRSTVVSPRLLAALLMAVVLAALAGCGTIVETLRPETTTQRIALAVASTNEIERQTVALLDAGALTAADGRNVRETTRALREGIDVARELVNVKADPKAADAKLAATTAGLRLLQRYLAERAAARPAPK
jgi:hypothetical protein